jgi:hypothetical protein
MKQIQSSKPTATTSNVAIPALIHVAQSAGLASLITLLASIGQYLSTGNLNWNGLFYVLGGGFLACLAMIWKSVSTSPNLAPAALELAQMAHVRIDQLVPWIDKVQTANVPTVPPAQQSGGGYEVVRQSTPYPTGQMPFPSQGLGYADLNRLPPPQQKDMSFLRPEQG